MSIQLRVLLLFGAVLTLVFFLRKIRKNRLEIDYSIFWVLFSGFLVLMSILPEAVTWAAGLLGFESPANMVFLMIVFLLIIRLFSMTVKISQMEQKLKKLVQHIAIQEHDHHVD